jgi:hypothetical protein
VSPQDRKALKEWVEYHSAEGDFEKFMKSLPSLPTGEGWIWSPEFMGVFERIKIRKRETFHPDREKIGDKFQLAELDKADIQDFIKKFSTTEAKGKNKKADTETDIGAKGFSQKEKIEIINLRNEYESKLLDEDQKIRKLQSIIDSIKKLVGVEGASLSPLAISSNLSFWIEKAGRGGEGKILKFLSEKAGNKFSRDQIGFAVGLSPSSGSFNTYISNLKRRKLIIEQSREIWINPEI